MSPVLTKTGGLVKGNISFGDTMELNFVSMQNNCNTCDIKFTKQDDLEKIEYIQGDYHRVINFGCNDKNNIHILLKHKNMSAVIDIQRTNNCIVINSGRTFYCSQKILLFEEILYRLPKFMEQVEDGGYREFMILDDSYSAVNLYKIFKVSSCSYHIIYPVPVKITYENNYLFDYKEKFGFCITRK